MGHFPARPQLAFLASGNGTIRKEFGGSLGENAVHGSDSEENAAIEIAYFFSRLELV